MKKAHTYTVKKTTATIYKIALKDNSTWIHITLEEWDRGGAINIDSCYGTYNSKWGNTGMPFRKFLMGLNSSYFIHNCIGSDMYEFDIDATLASIKKQVKEETGADTVQYYLDELKVIAKKAHKPKTYYSEYNFLEDFVETQLFREYYVAMSAVPIENKVKPICNAFWEELWPLACDIWKKELGEDDV